MAPGKADMATPHVLLCYFCPWITHPVLELVPEMLLAREAFVLSNYCNEQEGNFDRFTYVAVSKCLSQLRSSGSNVALMCYGD